MASKRSGEPTPTKKRRCRSTNDEGLRCQLTTDHGKRGVLHQYSEFDKRKLGLNITIWGTLNLSDGKVK